MASESHSSSEPPPSIQVIQTSEQGTTNSAQPFTEPRPEASDGTSSILLGSPQPETLVQQRYGIQEKDLRASGAASLLHVSIAKGSPLFKRHWVNEPLDSEGENPLRVLEGFQNAVGEVDKARKNLVQCFTETTSSDESRLVVNQQESGEECTQEAEEYKKKCATLVEEGEEMRQFYVEKLERLEEDYKTVCAQKEASDKQHKKQEGDLRYTVEIQSKYCKELEKRLDKQESELTDFESKFKAKQDEVKSLRETLQEKETQLGEMEKELTTRTNKVEELKTEAKAVVIGEERKTAKEQVERCQEIMSLVQRLPNATREDSEKITQGIIDDITRIKSMTTRKKAISFR